MPIVCRGCNKEATKHTCSRFTPLWTENRCQDLINSFYVKYPGIMRDRKRHHQRVREKGYIWDMWGRILHVTAVRSVLEWVVSAALREAANLPYQGSAQGCLKISMASIQDDLEFGGMLEVAHPLLQVHDELVFECREDIAADLGALVKHRMETSCQLDGLNIVANTAIAESWGTLEK